MALELGSALVQVLELALESASESELEQVPVLESVPDLELVMGRVEVDFRAQEMDLVRVSESESELESDLELELVVDPVRPNLHPEPVMVVLFPCLRLSRQLKKSLEEKPRKPESMPISCHTS